ncbi:MAG: hypothetical protein JW994_05330, partial [Candidatus Omnitrophica bacterium]|nr:hypothetical protein [Candidatus Omnitrophota bacterium]
MFRDRDFNMAIAFSTMWHLFWISAIGIVIPPSVQPNNVYQEVDFLGPILEKTAFDILSEKATVHTETLYAKTALFVDKVYLKPKGPERKVMKKFMPSSFRERFTFSLKEYIKDAKEIPL